MGGRLNGAANSDDHAYALAVDAAGNAYVTGDSRNGSNVDDLTVKYDGAGVQQWATRFNGAANRDDEAHALALDPAGNV